MVYNINIKALVLIALSYCFITANAQVASSLYFMETIPQNNMLNPAMTPRANIFIGFPGVNTIHANAHTGFSGDEILQQHNGDWFLPTNKMYDYGQLNKQLGTTTSISEEVSISPLYFGFRSGKSYFTFAFSQKITSRIDIATDLLNVGDELFPAGSHFDYSTFGIKSMAYKEFSIGYAREISSRLTVGGHIKPLFGQVAAVAKINSFELSTDLNEWELALDGEIHTSAPFTIDSISKNGYPKEIEPEEFETEDLIKDYGFSFSNPGIAIDLGGVYELNQAWTFSASVNNLGFISWKEDLNSVKINGSHNLTGIDGKYEDLDDIGGLFEDLADTIKNTLPAEIGTESFRTNLSPVAYVGAMYNVNHYLGIGALSRSYFQKNNFRQDFRFSANVNLYRAFSTTVNYNVAIKGSNDLGFGFALRGGPFQFYLMLDHIPVSYNPIEDGDSTYPAPLKFDTATLTCGINLLIGANGFKDKPMVDSYSEY